MRDVFKALADPTRREILLMVSQNPIHVNVIAEKFQMSRPAVSKHVKVLETHGLLEIRSDEGDGRQRICYPQLDALKEVEAYIRKLEKFWSERLNALGDYLDKLEAEEKSGNEDE